MKFNIGATLEDINGDVIKSGPQPDAQAALLGEIAMTALLEDQPNEQTNEGKKFHRWNLAKRIKKGLTEKTMTLELPSEDITLIKERIGRYFPTRFVGPAFMAIEQSKNESAELKTIS